MKKDIEKDMSTGNRERGRERERGGGENGVLMPRQP